MYLLEKVLSLLARYSMLAAETLSLGVRCVKKNLCGYVISVLNEVVMCVLLLLFSWFYSVLLCMHAEEHEQRSTEKKKKNLLVTAKVPTLS